MSTDQVKANQALVADLLAKAEESKKAALAAQIQQGNKAQIVVIVENYIADSGEEYEGTIIFRRPSPKDYIRIGAVKSELMRSYGIRPLIDPLTGEESMAHVDTSIKFLLTAMATFRVVLIDGPDWAKNYEDNYDTDVIVHVYDRFEEALTYFRRQAKSGTSGVSEGAVNTADVDAT